MKKIGIICAICAPLLLNAAVFTPEDVERVYYVKDGNDYEIHLFLKAGNFYKFGEVEYKGSRYNLLEDTARAINDDRNFTSFDDDDLVYLLDGVVPYTNNDIKEVEVAFTDKDVSIDVRFFTGGGFSVNETYDRKFLTRANVANYVVDIINKQDGFEGEYTAQQILDQYEVFEDITYYAPDVRSIEISYDKIEQLFVADVVFENEAKKKYAVFPKDTRRKIVVDVSARINEFYDDFEEEGSVTPDLVEETATWKDIPTLIDEIESITVQRKDTETIYVLVFIPQSDGTIAETLLETRFTEDFTQREDLSIAIADLFDKSAEFGDEFDLITLEEITLVGDIDLARYILVDENGDPIEEDEVEEEPTEEPEPTTPVDTEQSSSTPIVVEEEEPTQEEPEESTGIDESIIEQLIAVILQIIAESGLDIDISELTN